MNKETFLNKPLPILLSEYSFLEYFFTENNINSLLDNTNSFKEAIESLDSKIIETHAIDKELLLNSFYEYYIEMKTFLSIDEKQAIRTLTILPGTNKDGQKESFEPILINTGDIISIVGKTGSGKSRLLADIEWLAQADTPTNRTILVNQETPDLSSRQSGQKIVALLSQNMNFVMDLTVESFLTLHASSRLIKNSDEIVKRIYTEAIALSGESFSINTPITSLSGGQSRALMIADVALLSSSAIVLIDEIENAGIDRKKALDLLVGEDKIVLMATHDPLLALMANKRIIIENGAIKSVIETSNEEIALHKELEKLDKIFQEKRTSLRNGEILYNNL